MNIDVCKRLTWDEMGWNAKRFIMWIIEDVEFCENELLKAINNSTTRIPQTIKDPAPHSNCSGCCATKWIVIRSIWVPHSLSHLFATVFFFSFTKISNFEAVFFPALNSCTGFCTRCCTRFCTRFFTRLCSLYSILE